VRVLPSKYRALFLLVAAAAVLECAAAAGSSTEATGPNGKIAFIRAAPTGGTDVHIVVTNADGSGERQLTEGNVQDFEPAWSPDGQRLAFVRRVSSHGIDVFVINADGSGLRQLTRTPGDEGDVAWSPDGRSLAFARYADPSVAGAPGGVFVVELASGDSRRLTRSPVNVVDLSWAANRQRIAFATARGVIFVVNADGSGLRRLTSTPILRSGYGYYFATWSPGGRKIAFVTMPGRYNSIYVVGLDGRKERLLTRHAYTEPGFAWSPGGRQIVYSREKRRGVYVINVDGSADRRITADTVPEHLISGFAWSRNGRTIAYTTDRTGNGDIYLLTIGESGRRQLTNGPAIDGKPVWWEPPAR
jgi:TolB protein